MNFNEYALEKKEALIALASAIRDKTGSSANLSVSDMVTEVQNISVGDTDGTKVNALSFTLDDAGTGYKVTSSDSLHIILDKYDGIPIVEIENDAFNVAQGRHGVTSIQLPETLRRIGSYAFGDNYYLQEIVVPHSVTELGNGAFSYSGLTKATLGGGLFGALPADLFSGCSNLTDIYLAFNSDSYEGAPWGAPETVQLHYSPGVVPAPPDWT